MSTGMRLAGLLLLTTSLTFPAVVHAQDADPADTGQDALTDDVQNTDQDAEAQQPDISVPGGGIIVTGRRNRNPERASTQVLSVLSEADIARTGESDIAGALGRVTGLSVVGDGRVYVRGLGDRYSLALLNGLPLPSPEPLSRVVPLDIFPTSVVASSLIQKTYSANFPGEFGGGVINLTTKAVPTENFLDVSFSGGGDTETTFENGLTYFGSRWDTFGFDNGNRDVPSFLQQYFDSGLRLGDIPVNADPANPTALTQEAIARQLFPTNLVTLQKTNKLPINFSANITGGLSFDVGSDATLGIIATGGIRNNWRNRSVISQTGNTDLSALNEDYTTFITDNKVLVNALLGFGLDFGNHKIRWTNLYIRDTLKTARLQQGTNFLLGDSGFDFANQQTAWFERQLIDTQLVTELDFDRLKVDLRGGYARTDREAPYNANIRYTRTNRADSPYGNQFVAYFNQESDTGVSTVAFDDLQEDLYFAGADVSYELTDSIDLTVGGAYNDTARRSSSREFLPRIQADNSNPDLGSLGPGIIPALGLRRPGDIINGATLAGFQVSLSEVTDFPVFDAALKVYAGYGQLRWVPIESVTIDAGVRYEDAEQTVDLDQTIFETPITGATATNLMNDYFLPGGTITWEVTDKLQLRASASKTIGRPQFRELVEQTYFDPESNRRFRGNPFLVDTELFNAEARAEYYFTGRDRVSLAGFYKKIDNPIESFVFSESGFGGLLTSFANAPSASLYGAELDLAYGIDLYNMGGFLETKQILVLANYTYSSSSLKVSDGDVTFHPLGAFGTGELAANQLFNDGAPLVGQSDHLANLSLGIEDTEKVQQLTFLFNYASKRVVSRGFNQPDVVEDPGLTVDIVARSDVKLAGLALELSLEARNIFGRDHLEYQQLAGNRVEFNTYQVGTGFSFGVKAKF
ncbi:MAG: TonB-dependent receptor [Porphyrobacter sp.]|nr:TonB-dependent receptor [Porphyrobacter sp.]